MIYHGEDVLGMRRYTVTTSDGGIYRLSAHDAKDAAAQAEVLANHHHRVLAISVTPFAPALTPPPERT